MRTTMLHISHELDDTTREQFCASLHEHGVNCTARPHSAKPHLLFVDYDESQTEPSQLVKIANAAGYPAQLVDI